MRVSVQPKYSIDICSPHYFIMFMQHMFVRYRKVMANDWIKQSTLRYIII